MPSIDVFPSPASHTPRSTQPRTDEPGGSTT